jgi:isoaspartyl peptidase/L-asparaginase-like protein (Ntn-hydrolase superfamily)
MSTEKLSRRAFFGGVAALGATALAPKVGWARPASKSQTATGRPFIISTWKQGKPANEKAAEVLTAGGSLVDAVEKGVNTAELDPEIMSVGYGAYPNEEGVVQLDAVIMDGLTHRAGAVAALEKIATPISVARRVMEKTYHVLLAGQDALRFALEEGFEPQQLLTPKALEAWMKWKADPNRKFHRRGDPSRRLITQPEPQASAATLEHDDGDTITMAILDEKGNLAAGGSTSGLKWKVPGRVGDVPLLGCGIFVDNAVGAAGATGDGDEMQKFATSATIVERMRAGMDPQSACESVLRRMLEVNPENKVIEACVYAVSKKGEYGTASIRGVDFTYAVWMPGVSELRKAASVL